MEIQFSANFQKQYKKSPAKIKIAFASRLKLFSDNPRSPILRNHALIGKYQEYHSINITGDWRALYRASNTPLIVIFEILGTHSQLYK